MVALRGAPGLSGATSSRSPESARRSDTTWAGSPRSRGRTRSAGSQLPLRESLGDGIPGLLLRGVPGQERARLPRRDGVLLALLVAGANPARRGGAALPAAGRRPLSRLDRHDLQHRDPPPAARLPVPRAGGSRRASRAPGNAAGPRARPALAALCALPVVSAVELVRIHPHELSYFNPFAGGTGGGAQILSDSNVDWGLDLKRLAAELSRRGVTDPTVAYFGGDDVFERIGVSEFAAEPEVRGRLDRRLRLLPGGRARFLCVSWCARSGRGPLRARAGGRGAGPACRPHRLLDQSLRVAPEGKDWPLKLSVVMPVYNEAKTVREIVRLVLDVPIDKEILIVDDGSTDGTRDILREMDGKGGIRVFLQPRQPGQGRGGVGRLPVRRPATSSSCRTPTSSTTPKEYVKLLGPIARRPRRRRLRLALPRRRRAARPLLLAHGRQPVPDARLEHVHRT